MKFIMQCLSAVLVLSAIDPALAQRAIRTNRSGSWSDFHRHCCHLVAGVVAPKLGDGLGQSVVVDNSPGRAAKSAPSS